ncbi:hypothetical protein JXA47_12425 [Candidatus Sumerlaeota bacterium]|nr:hypothetical protein [Candidatus Sumerlaeota bacterium]
MGSRITAICLPVLATLLVSTGSLPADQTIPSGILGGATWSEGEVITVLGSISVTGDLIIEPDVEVRVTPPGTSITVENGGRLLAEGEASREIRFLSSASTPTPGEWDGITLETTSVDTSVLRHVEVEHARVGLRILGVSPSVEHCAFRNLGSADGALGVNGNPGADGGDAKETVGITVIGPSQATIRHCLVENVTGGNGGGAGSGLPGADGFDGILPDTPGTDGNAGALAGTGGRGADAAGILIFGAGATPTITENTIRSLRGGNGGGGGRGGDGGNGGNGGPNADGGDGALGRRGGEGGEGGAAIGIQASTDASPVLLSNEISDLTGGNGGRGGDTGNGGSGGRGGDGENATQTPLTDGKPGGNGGDGFPGISQLPHAGSGGAGGDTVGVFGLQASLEVISHSIRDLTGGQGGMGGNAGTAGAGGDGGRGGAGLNSPPANAGAGGDGGEGARGYAGGSGGVGGAAVGIGVETADSIAIRNNVIETLRGGPAGPRGTGGNAGAGGQGGPAGIGLQSAPGGSGGPGGDGHYGGSIGARGGSVYGVRAVSVPNASETTANRIRDLVGGEGGDGGTPGLAGPGGDGGGGAGSAGPSGTGGQGGEGSGGNPGGTGGHVWGITAYLSDLLTTNNLIWDLRGGTPGMSGPAADGGPGGSGGVGLFVTGSGGNGGDGGQGAKGGEAGSILVLIDVQGTIEHYHETLADFDAGLPGSAPTPGGQGGAGGTGDPDGTPGTDGPDGAPASLSYGVGMATAINSISTFNNCIVWQPAPSAAIGVSAEGTAMLQTDFNIYHNMGTAVLGTTLGGNDLLADPLFADPTAGDFQLTRLSPAVDTGTARAITEDIDGNPRPFDVLGRGADQTGFEFDRGAYESITGRTGYRTDEIVEALLTRTSAVPQSDPLDVNDDSEFDAADVTANVNDVDDALP